MRLGDLRIMNRARQKEWPGNGQADLSFRAIEVAGEAGELMEAVKKHLRGQKGIGGGTASISDIADEIADVIIAVDLLADCLGVDVAYAVFQKFNATSEKHGLKTRFPGGES